ncbi:MAG: putative toxin-antitoxin system toxin component, PIN family [Deltaproteobacteria bacterium RBG_16_48_10]|nr:MAG: putative toxin-antitoxin system toxin component, PIN family [Deltaproteobacteria bacterium RBG_16_48_10]
MLRVVLDTNVLISAILFGGNPRQILEKAIRGEIRLCISEPILEEFKGVLQRSKFDYSPEMIQVILTELTGIADFVNPSKTIDVVLEDPGDNRVIECAAEAKANYIITGDFQLLKLSRYQNIEVLNAVAFLEKL